MGNEELSSRASILQRAAEFFRRSAREASCRAANTALGFLAAGALFPFLVEDPAKALAGLLGSASVEILTSWLMKSAGEKEADSAELIAAVKEELDASEGFRRAVEELLAKMGVGNLAAQAKGVLSDEDRQWFLDTLHSELNRYRFQYIEIRGDGNVVGDGNFAIVRKESHYHYHYYGPAEATLSMEARRELEAQHQETMAAVSEIKREIMKLAQRLPERETDFRPGEPKPCIVPELPASANQLSTDQLMQLGDDARRKGLHETALGFYEAVLSRNPDELLALQASAWTRYEMYDHEGALRRINRAKELASSDLLPYIEARRACILAELGHVRGMRSMVKEALTIFENIPLGLISQASRYYNIGNSLSFLGDCERATDHYEKALKALKDDTKSFQLKSMIWKNKGKCHEDCSDVDKAKDCYEEAIQTDPSNWKAYVGLASLALKEQRGADAVTAMELGWQHVEPFPASRQMALEWRVAAFAQVGNVESIWQLANDYPEIALASNYIQQFLPVGISALWRENDAYVPAALEFYRGRVEDFPDDQKAWLELFNLYVYLGEQARAAEIAERALGRDHASAQLHHQYAHLLEAMGQSDEAVAHLETAANLAPSHHHFHCLALLHMKMEEYEEAARRFEQALGDASDEAKILDGLGYCYYKLDRYQDARQAMEELLALEPDNPHAWSNLGICYQALGMWQEASEAFARAESCTRET